MRDRRLLATATLAIAIAAVAVVVLATSSSTPSSAAGSSRTASGAATVQRRNLVETDTESGTLSYSDPQTVYDRLSGTVTWLPSAGRLIKPGQALFDVDNAPVLLMNGSTPAYRELDSADGPGPDITELNRNLVDLGFAADDIAIDDEWQAGTTVGIEELQASKGEVETGTLALGDVVFLPGVQLISTVDGTVGATGGGSAATASLIDPPSRPELVGLTTTTTTPATTTPATTTTTTTTTRTRPKRHRKRSAAPSSREQLQALLALLRAEVAQLHSGHSLSTFGTPSRSSPPRKSSSGANKSSSSGSQASKASNSSSSAGAGGGGGGNASAILQTSSDHLTVTVELAATSQSEAKVGEPVTIEMPAGNTMNGVITQVSAVAQTSSNSGSGSQGAGNGGGGNSGSGSSATIPVTIALHGHVRGAGLDQAAVSVNFAEAKARNVLSVPVTCLLATSGSSYAVQEANPPHKLIPVTTGLFAAGYVAISGPGIFPGLQVTDSQG